MGAGSIVSPLEDGNRREAAQPPHMMDHGMALGHIAAIGRRSVFAAVLGASALLPAFATGTAGSGPHEKVDVGATTTRPAASTGLTWTATYHSSTDPGQDPPPLRRLVIHLPRGTRYDTSVPGQCAATDQELMLLGAAACPPSSRVGTSQVTVKTLSLGVSPSTYQGIDFNADHQLIELFESGGRPVGVARTYAKGGTLDGPVPTCITGGDPPSGCPFDQLTLISNKIEIQPLSVGSGRHRRNFATTPATCPRSGRWTTPVTFYYADGSVDHVVTHQPCTQPRQRRAHRHRAS